MLGRTAQRGDRIISQIPPGCGTDDTYLLFCAMLRSSLGRYCPSGMVQVIQAAIQTAAHRWGGKTAIEQPLTALGCREYPELI
jgi:hypothetical protein